MEIVEATTVKTLSYVLEEKPVMRMIRGRILRQQLIAAVVIVLVAVFIANVRGRSSLVFVAIFAGVYGLWVVGVGYLRGIDRQRQALIDAGWFSVPHWNVTDGEFFGTYERGGQFSKNKLEGLFKRVELRDEYYFLQYASNTGMLMIPARAFESEADRQRFEQLLADKGVPVVRRGRKHEAA